MNKNLTEISPFLDFNSNAYGGEKHLILTTVSIFGGKNIFLYKSYYYCGVICFMITFCFYKRKQWDEVEMRNFKEELEKTVNRER